MSTRKTTATPRAEATAQLRRRAEKIINNNAQAYDRETREAVSYALRCDGPEDLKQTIRQVERGETIIDTRIPARHSDEAARLIKRLFEAKGVPDYLTDAVMCALEEAAGREGLNIMDDEKADFDLRALSDLLTITRSVNYPVELEPKKGLAELLSAVLKHPDVPTTIYNSLADEINSLGFEGDSPDYIRLTLDYHAQKGGAR